MEPPRKQGHRWVPLYMQIDLLRGDPVYADGSLFLYILSLSDQFTKIMKNLKVNFLKNSELSVNTCNE